MRLFHPPRLPRAFGADCPLLTLAQQTEALRMAFPLAAGTILNDTDRMTVLEVQRHRTPAMEAWARSVKEARIWVNAEVLGPGFAPKNLPICTTNLHFHLFLRRSHAADLAIC